MHWKIKTDSYFCSFVKPKNNMVFCENRGNKGSLWRYDMFKNYPRCLEKDCPLKYKKVT